MCMRRESDTVYALRETQLTEPAMNHEPRGVEIVFLDATSMSRQNDKVL